jgi:malonate transporter and related proteins
MATRKKSMSTILNSIIPLVLIILAGLAAGVTGLLPSAFRTPLSDFCYYFGMPALLVRTIATAPSGSTAAHLIWISYLLPAVAIWILASLFARQDRSNSSSEAPAIAMASAYGNVIMLGIPLAFTQFGPKAATTVALIVLVHSPVLFLLAALHGELSDGGRASRSHGAALLTPMGIMNPHRGTAVGASLVRAIRDVSIDLATNPIIIAILIGLALRTSGIGLDPISSAALSLVGQATLPCVLLAMGLGLSTFALEGKIGVIAIISSLKLGAMPAIAFLVAARLFHLPSTDVAIITLLSAMPTGANAYVFARRSGKAEASVSGAVALSTVVSIVTITAVLAMLARAE